MREMAFKPFHAAMVNWGQGAGDPHPLIPPTPSPPFSITQTGSVHFHSFNRPLAYTLYHYLFSSIAPFQCYFRFRCTATNHQPFIFTHNQYNAARPLLIFSCCHVLSPSLHHCPVQIVLPAVAVQSMPHIVLPPLATRSSTCIIAQLY